MKKEEQSDHNAKEDFILRTYSMLGPSTIALAAWGVVTKTETSSLFWFFWAIHFLSFVRIAIGGYAIYNYLFALKNMEKSFSMRWAKKINTYQFLRNVGAHWYLIALFSFVTTLLTKVLPVVIKL